MSAYVSYGYGFIQGLRFAILARFPWSEDPAPEPCPDNADRASWLKGFAAGVMA